MNFLAPAYFWTFLLLVPLVGLYFLKVRPRRRTTTAYFLWEKVFQEKRTTALFQRLRDLLSLVLLALALSAIALALTQPELEDDERRDLLLLVDQSVSMKALSEGSSLERAKKEVRRVIRGLRGNQRAAVASVAQSVVFHSHLTDNPRALLDAVDLIQPTNLPLDPQTLASLSLPSAVADPAVPAEAGREDANADPSSDGAEGRHRFLFFTDGAFDKSEIPDVVEVLPVREALENVGIVAADLQVLPASEQRLGFFFQLASSFSSELKADLTVRRADSGAIGKLIEVVIRPGLNPPEVYTLEEWDSGEWIVELELEDALADDNTAYLVAQQPPPVGVQVVGDDGFFFQNAVLAFSRFGSLALVESDGDLVMSQASSPEARASLIFKPDGTSPWWEALGADLVEDVVPKVLLKEHPVLRYLDAATLRFVGARELQAPEGSLILVASDQGVPLIFQVQDEDRVAVVVNMDPLASDFYFSAWFPVLVHAVAEHLSGREESLLASYATGSTVPVPGARLGEATEVLTPGGRIRSREVRLLEPLQAFGFYRMTNSSGAWSVGASLLNVSESSLGGDVESTVVEDLASGESIAWWLTLLAVAIVVIESVLYHRRKVG